MTVTFSDTQQKLVKAAAPYPSPLGFKAQLHFHPDRCKINLVRCRGAHARQIKLMEQISLLIKMKIHVSCNLAEH